MVSVGIRPNAYGGDGGVCVTFDLYFKTHIVHKCIFPYFLVEQHCRDYFTAVYLQKIEILISRWKLNNRTTRLPGVIDINGDYKIAVFE